MDARWHLKLVIDGRVAAHRLDPHPPTGAFGAKASSEKPPAK